MYQNRMPTPLFLLSATTAQPAALEYMILHDSYTPWVFLSLVSQYAKVENFEDILHR
jgi:hypothetical protein